MGGVPNDDYLALGGCTPNSEENSRRVRWQMLVALAGVGEEKEVGIIGDAWSMLGVPGLLQYLALGLIGLGTLTYIDFVVGSRLLWRTGEPSLGVYVGEVVPIPDVVRSEPGAVPPLATDFSPATSRSASGPRLMPPAPGRVAVTGALEATSSTQSQSFETGTASMLEGSSREPGPSQPSPLSAAPMPPSTLSVQGPSGPNPPVGTAMDGNSASSERIEGRAVPPEPGSDSEIALPYYY